MSRAIRNQVARRREAQLAAMVEGRAATEVLTFTPGERAHDRWLQRTISNVGQKLGRVRDRVIDARGCSGITSSWISMPAAAVDLGDSASSTRGRNLDLGPRTAGGRRAPPAD